MAKGNTEVDGGLFNYFLGVIILTKKCSTQSYIKENIKFIRVEGRFKKKIDNIDSVFSYQSFVTMRKYVLNSFSFLPLNFSITFNYRDESLIFYIENGPEKSMKFVVGRNGKNKVIVRKMKGGASVNIVSNEDASAKVFREYLHSVVN